MQNIPIISLGKQGLQVPTIGLGCMGMTPIAGNPIYGQSNEAAAIATIHRSLELGGNFLDTADLYGPFLNEQLIAKAVAKQRDRYIIATKFGYEIDDAAQLTWRINGSAAYVKKAVERSLTNLKTDYIDLYYLHRLDPNTPIEETVDAMSSLVKEGKVRYIGLSEVSAATILKAHQIHPLTAVQTEYSFFERSIEVNGVADALQSLGIGLVAYSPLGRGFLTSNFTISSPAELADNDFRKTLPRFSEAYFYKNKRLSEQLTAMASRKKCTLAQLAIAWVIAKGHLPIPGTKTVQYLEENLAAANIQLTEADLLEIETIIPVGTQTGDRYDAANMQAIDQ